MVITLARAVTAGLASLSSSPTDTTIRSLGARFGRLYVLASLLEGKSWITERIIKLNPMIVLDIGVGSGTYSRLLKPALDPVCVFIGFETYAPYVEKYNLNEHYHAIITEDVRKILVLPDADVVILGDVLEHMTYVEAA